MMSWECQLGAECKEALMSNYCRTKPGVNCQSRRSSVRVLAHGLVHTLRTRPEEVT